jgi:hypothetical protein
MLRTQKEVLWTVRMTGLKVAPFSAYSSIPLQPTLSYVNEPKTLIAGEGYRIQGGFLLT